MNTYLLNIRKILDLKKWKKTQDEISMITGMSAGTVDYKGLPVTKNSGYSKFCRRVRSNQETAKYCQKCDSRGGLEAVRLNKPYIYLCHLEIVDVAVPIIMEDKYVGALMIGQILVEECEKDKLEKITTSQISEELIQKDETLRKYYRELPVFSFAQINIIANMLMLLCNYIVEEAIYKNLFFEAYDKMSQHTLESIRFSNDLKGYPLEAIMNVKNQVEKAITSKQIDALGEEDGMTPQNPMIRPAVEYIHAHKNEYVTLNQMAKLCHTSTGYFSRVFKKEMGESFSDYVYRFKMGVSKKMLEKTNHTVSKIASDLGFADTGYFIKRFKKQEGVTPAMYRKYLK